MHLNDSLMLASLPRYLQHFPPLRLARPDPPCSPGQAVWPQCHRSAAAAAAAGAVAAAAADAGDCGIAVGGPAAGSLCSTATAPQRMQREHKSTLSRPASVHACAHSRSVRVRASRAPDAHMTHACTNRTTTTTRPCEFFYLGNVEQNRDRDAGLK